MLNNMLQCKILYLGVDMKLVKIGGLVGGDLLRRRGLLAMIAVLSIHDMRNQGEIKPLFSKGRQED